MNNSPRYRNFLLFLVAAAIPSVGATSQSQAVIIGDDVSVSSTDALSAPKTGTAGTDDFSIIYSSNFNTVIDPVFSNSSIDLVFSTNFSTGGWFFSNAVITISDLDWGGAGTIANATLVDTVSDPNLTGSDLTFLPTSVSLDLDGVILRNGETLTIQIEARHIANIATPEPATATLGMLGIAGLMLRRRKTV